MRWLRGVALIAFAVLLIGAGMVLRPMLVPDNQSTPSVLNPTEIGFAQDMLSHHQQALLMVQRLDPGVDASIKSLAQQISDAQRVEIGTMLGWLRLANASPTNPNPMEWMATDESAAHQHSSDGLMPGMATLAELDALSAAHGADAETLFLQLMQRHHLGGVAMAEAADHLLAAGAVKEAARGMITAQNQEAGIMTVVLAQRGAQPLP